MHRCCKMSLKEKIVGKLSLVSFHLCPSPSLPGQATCFPGLLREEASFSFVVLCLNTSFLVSGQVFAFSKEKGGYRHNKSLTLSNVSWVWAIKDTPFSVTAVSGINIFWMCSSFSHTFTLGKFLAALRGWFYLSLFTTRTSAIAKEHVCLIWDTLWLKLPGKYNFYSKKKKQSQTIT